MDAQEGGAVLLAATTSFTVFTALLPEFADVRKAVGQPDVVNDVRMGEVAAAGTAVAIGLIASSVTKSPAPAIAAILCAAGLVAMYESILRSIPTEKEATK